MVSIAVLDDHRAVLDAVIIALSLQNDIIVQGAFSESELLLHNLYKLQPDVLILDVYLTHGNAVSILQAIKIEFPQLKVLLFTSCTDVKLLAEMYAIGIYGFVPKDAPFNTLLQGIHTVAKGEEFYPSSVQPLYRQMKPKGQMLKKQQPEISPLEVLTNVEKDILKYTLQEYTTKEIANALSITEHTVERQRKLMLQKLGVNNITMLHQFAARYNLYNNRDSQVSYRILPN